MDDVTAARVAARFASGTSRKAFLSDGPIGRVLEKWWNELHDLEYDLKKTIQDYSSASSYGDGPAVKDAKAVIKQIEDGIQALQKIADSGGVFDDLVKAEEGFTKKYGDPAAYVEQQRAKMFSR